MMPLRVGINLAPVESSKGTSSSSFIRYAAFGLHLRLSRRRAEESGDALWGWGWWVRNLEQGGSAYTTADDEGALTGPGPPEAAFG